MSDYNSSLPIRTEADGDAVVKVGDGATPSQYLGIDASGRVVVKINDGSGNSLTSQASGGQRALDVGINVAGVQIDPRDMRALTSADIVTVEQGTSPWIVKDVAAGAVAGGTAGTFSLLAGGIYNATPLTLTDGQQAALQVDASGKLLVSASVTSSDDHDYGTVGAATLRTAAQLGNATGAAAWDFGASSAQTLRVAALVGNASGLASFGNGATGAQTLRVAANLAVGGADVSGANPVPVTISGATTGTEVLDFAQASAVAASSSSTHSYAVTSTKTLTLQQVVAAGSGKIKVAISMGTTGSEVLKAVLFNSTSSPNVVYTFAAPQQLADTESVKVVITNLDKQAQDLYSTIEGFES
jgi:hypothetical protein